ncbi:SDR family oxidoreductase [Streptomyces kunmingensis]|uniref:SDR family oxidoreductase n=1 Tax=Streptomyces kunmingensis TaxID=68225 RepID=A0ABU6CMD7_9ACTN|nr:SDR family oxidoreductase [Streptomyces kunmingensis]MEB3965116.1 SDR family oxidoreductase [Streptomyces kunmingensis]
MRISPLPTSKIVLVTGASSGIGEATARHLAAAGHHVVLGARRIERLARIIGELTEAGYSAEYAELDVTDIDSVRGFAEAALTRHGRIDVLVNNAGVMPLASFTDLRVDEWNQMIDVNLRGTLHGIAAVLPSMRERRSGQIINIASTSAYRVDPTAAVYCATKYAVRALTEGLRQENTDVRVTLISPGFTRSELADQGGDEQARSVAKNAMDAFGLPASAVAEAIGHAVAQPASVDVSEIVVRPTPQG